MGVEFKEIYNISIVIPQVGFGEGSVSQTLPVPWKEWVNK